MMEPIGTRDLESSNRGTRDTAAEDWATEVEVLKVIELATKAANARAALRAAESRAAEGRGYAPEEEVMDAVEIARSWARIMGSLGRLSAMRAKARAARTKTAQARVVMARTLSAVARQAARAKTANATFKEWAGAREARLAKVWALSTEARAEATAKGVALRTAVAAAAEARAAEVKGEADRAAADKAAVATEQTVEGEEDRAAERAALAAVFQARALARSMASAPGALTVLSRMLEERGGSRQLERAGEVPAQVSQATEFSITTTAPTASELPVAIRGLADIVGRQRKVFGGAQRVWATGEHTIPEPIPSLSASSGSSGGGRRRGRGEDQASDQAAEGEEELIDEAGDKDESEEEATGLTPAELLAGGDSVGSNGGRNDQGDGVIPS